jgi:hypothetical protein
VNRIRFRCPFVSVEGTGVVRPLGVGFARAPLERFVKCTGDRPSYELGAFAAPSGSDLLELPGSTIIELDEDLFHMIEHMIKTALGNQSSRGEFRAAQEARRE